MITTAASVGRAGRTEVFLECTEAVLKPALANLLESTGAIDGSVSEEILGDDGVAGSHVIEPLKRRVATIA